MFVRVGVCVGCEFVASGCGVVVVGLGGCVFVHLRLWRLCGGLLGNRYGDGVYWERLR